MNNIRSDRSISTHKLRMIKAVVKELQNTKFLVILLLLVMIIGFFNISPAISSLMNHVIKSTGEILIPGTHVTARSGSARDIQMAVDQVVAAGGIGNITIPAGIWNFYEAGETWKRVVVPEGISIFGAPSPRDADGQNLNWSTVLVMPESVPSNLPGESFGTAWFEFRGVVNPDKPSRISNIKFIGYRYFDNTDMNIHRAVVINQIANFRIDHCFFQDIPNGVWIGGEGVNHPYGVIDHNRFVNTIGYPYDFSVGYGVLISTLRYPYFDDNIYNVIGKYTNYTVFIEDNYFEKWRHCVASNNGAHYVFRYNTIKYDYGYGAIDVHGKEGYEGQYSGGRASEIYNNTIISPVKTPPDSEHPDGIFFAEAIWIRGGGGVIFNNYVKDWRLFVKLEAEGSEPKYYPHDIYIWNNVLENVTWNINIPDPTNIQENVDYFLYKMPGYTPYPYPHPLTLKGTI